jgi:hypothetical protein
MTAKVNARTTIRYASLPKMARPLMLSIRPG